MVKVRSVTKKTTIDRIWIDLYTAAETAYVGLARRRGSQFSLFLDRKHHTKPIQDLTGWIKDTLVPRFNLSTAEGVKIAVDEEGILELIKSAWIRTDKLVFDSTR